MDDAKEMELIESIQAAPVSSDLDDVFSLFPFLSEVDHIAENRLHDQGQELDVTSLAATPSVKVTSVDGMKLVAENKRRVGAPAQSNNFSIQSTRPLVPLGSILYYELKVLTIRSLGVAAIGLAKGGYHSNQLPGWLPKSYGWHSDDGKKFSGPHSGTDYELWGEGDTVGLLLNMRTKELTFTHNGVKLPTAFSNVSIEPNTKLYATIGLDNSTVQLNFGASPFAFNLNSVLQEERLSFHHSIKTTTNAVLEKKETEIMNALIRSYLVREGYSQTLAAFDKSAEKEKKTMAIGQDHDGMIEDDQKQKQESKPDEQELKKDFGLVVRGKVMELIRQGQAVNAIALVVKHFPQLWNREIFSLEGDSESPFPSFSPSLSSPMTSLSAEDDAIEVEQPSPSASSSLFSPSTRGCCMSLQLLLHSMHFLELMRANQIEEALQVAQESLYPFLAISDSIVSEEVAFEASSISYFLEEYILKNANGVREEKRKKQKDRANGKAELDDAQEAQQEENGTSKRRKLEKDMQSEEAEEMVEERAQKDEEGYVSNERSQGEMHSSICKCMLQLLCLSPSTYLTKLSGVLAYPNLLKSPLHFLFSQAFKNLAAEECNNLMMKSLNPLLPTSGLEQTCRQLLEGYARFRCGDELKHESRLSR